MGIKNLFNMYGAPLTESLCFGYLLNSNLCHLRALSSGRNFTPLLRVRTICILVAHKYNIDILSYQHIRSKHRVIQLCAIRGALITANVAT